VTEPEKFFREQSGASAAKTRIIGNFFSSWANIVVGEARRRGNPITYIDMYCGPGRYEDGRPSTPLVVLEKAIANPRVAPHLVTIFNDEDPDFVEKLKGEVAKLPGIEKFVHQPIFLNRSIGRDTEQFFLERSNVATFAFVDPFGYTGLTLDLIKWLTRGWGSDCLFFFNYARINRALSAGVFRAPMSAIFGEARVDLLIRQLTTIEADGKLTPYRREELIGDTLTAALQDINKLYVRPFTFRRDGRTSRKLVFVSKDIKGYNVMKDVMAGVSNVSRGGGVVDFTYSDVPVYEPILLMNFEFEQLKNSLCDSFSGQTVSLKTIFDKHNPGTDYLLRNYRDALDDLDRLGKVRTVPRKVRAGKITFGDEVRITFL
jgi:three-Cys-motif partner protein